MNWLIKLVYMNEIREVGAFEAKTHFAQLIEAAKGGTEIIVTRRGEAVARILPMGDRGQELSALIAEFGAIRAAARPGPSVKDLKEEGRR
jgi:prevent-host-death family protein